MSTGREYRVRVPPWAREAYGGSDRLRRRFADPVAARAWMAAAHAELEALRCRSERVEMSRRGQDGTVREVAVQWLAQADVSPGTRGWYSDVLNAHVLPDLRDVRVSTLSVQSITQWCAHLRAHGRSASTTKRALLVLKMSLKWAQANGYTVDPAAFRVRPPKTLPGYTRRFDPEATERFLTSVSGRDRAVLEVAASTGMRAGELRAFDCSWIRWREGRISIPADQTFAPKDRAPRSTPLHARLVRVLQEWLGDRRDGLVFPPQKGGKGVYVRGIIARAREASGVDFKNAHDLRHHFLSLLASKGYQIRDLMEISGHSDIATLQRYMHCARDYLSRARDLLDQDDVGAETGAAGKAKRPRLLGQSRS